MSDILQKQCSKCKKIFPATLQYFSPAKGKKYGLYSMCRDCKRESWQAWERRRKSMEAVPEEQKRCPKCKKVFPATLEFFSFQSGRKYNLTSWCRECNRNRKRKAYRQDKAVVNMSNGHSQISASIEQESEAAIGHRCDACGTTKGNIIGDVVEPSKEKYGYLCMKCYKLVRDSGGDATRIRKVLNYIEQTRLAPV